MNIWWILRTELRRLIRSRIGRAALIVGMIIPLLYSSLYLYAFWDPYNQLDQFPVALVNQDQGGVNDGKQVNYGKELVDQLVKEKKFDWQVVSLPDADKGLEDDGYYLKVVVPPSFTKDVLSMKDDNPHQAQLTFVPNEGKNYIASTITGKLLTSMREELGNKFTKEYIKGIFDVVGDAGNGLTKAADGANQLHDGSKQVTDGLKDLHQGTSTLATKSKKLADGAGQAADGAHQLAAGVTQANSAVGQIQTKVPQLQSGANRIAAGSSKLATSLTQSTQGVKQVHDQLNAALPNSDQLQGGLTQMQGVLGALGANGLPHAPSTQDPAQMPVLDMLGVLQQKYGIQANDPLYQGILQKVNGVSGHLGQTASKVGDSKAGLTQAVGALKQIADGQDQMVAGANQLSSGGKQLASGAGALQGAMTQLYSGTQTLATKSNELASGVGQVADGNRQAADGASQIADGNAKLVDGSQKVTDGSQELANKLTDATQNSTVKDPDKKAELMADPVAVNNEPVHHVPTYGTGFASYFIPLSFWVGAVVLYFILSMNEYRWTIAPVSSASIVLGKFLTLGLVGVLQAVISSLVLTQVLGLHVQHPVEFYLFNILMALTSIAIIGLLIARLGSGPGRFLAIVLLVLQLTSSAGTFPLELVPRFFQAIHPFLPMSYGISALRSIISTGNQSVVSHSVLVIGSILVAVLLIQIVTTRRTLKVQDLHTKDVLGG